MPDKVVGNIDCLHPEAKKVMVDSLRRYINEREDAAEEISLIAPDEAHSIRVRNFLLVNMAEELERTDECVF